MIFVLVVEFVDIFSPNPMLTCGRNVLLNGFSFQFFEFGSSRVALLRFTLLK